MNPTARQLSIDCSNKISVDQSAAGGLVFKSLCDLGVLGGSIKSDIRGANSISPLASAPLAGSGRG